MSGISQQNPNFLRTRMKFLVEETRHLSPNSLVVRLVSWKVGDSDSSPCATWSRDLNLSFPSTGLLAILGSHSLPILKIFKKVSILSQSGTKTSIKLKNLHETEFLFSSQPYSEINGETVEKKMVQVRSESGTDCLLYGMFCRFIEKNRAA